jgi:multidrug resistance efflux pump
MLDKTNPENIEPNKQDPKSAPLAENNTGPDPVKLEAVQDVPDVHEQTAQVSPTAALKTPPVQQDPKRSLFVTILRAIFQIILMAAVLFGAYTMMERLAASREEPQKRPFRQTAYTVETLTVERADHRPSVLVYGQIETARNVDLRALVSGEIISVNPNLSAGARIEKGDFLVEIDRFSYEGAIIEAKANLTQVSGAIREIDARLASESEQLISAEEQLELASADLVRAQSLVLSGTLTNKQADDRILIVSQRKQSVNLRRNNILIAEAQKEQQIANSERLNWKVREAERRLENTKLFAPFSGIISASNAEPGRSVGTNDVLASIYDDAALEVRFTLTNTQYGRMALDSDPLIGRLVDINWTIGSIAYAYQGKIDRIGATVVADRGGVEVVAVVDPTDHAVQIRPGAFVEINVPDRVYKDAIKVPETAIYDQSHVFVAQKGQLTQREIEILAYDGDSAIITSSKDASNVIANGDLLLITRLTEAAEGVRVKQPGPSGRPNGRPSGQAGGQNGNAGAQNSGTNTKGANAKGQKAGNQNQRGQNPNRPRAVNRGLGG